MIDLYCMFLGSPPTDAGVLDLKTKLHSLAPMGFQPGTAISVDSKDGKPPEHWFINRLVGDEVGKLTLVMERGNPMRPLAREEVKEAVASFVAALQNKPMPAPLQVEAITDFIADITKGRIYAGT